MKNVYTVLLVEDHSDDAELIEFRLMESELDIVLIPIQTMTELKESLEQDDIDLVISDYNLGDFSGEDTLDLVKSYSPNLPFILVSGHLGERKSVELMVAGANDVVMKDDLDRLNPVVVREILHYRESLKIQWERDLALQELQERVKEQQCLHHISRINEQNYSIAELLTRVVENLSSGFQYSDILEAKIEYDGHSFQTSKFKETEWSLTAENKTIEHGPLIVQVTYLEEKPDLDIGPFLSEERYLIDSVLDILSLKINRLLDKKKLDHKQELLENANDLAKIGNWEVDMVESTMTWSPQVYKIHEMEKSYEPILSEGLNFYKEGTHRETIIEEFTKAVEQGIPWDLELIIVTGKGNEQWIRTIGQPVFENGTCTRVYGSFQNIDNRKRTEIQLQQTEKKLRDIVEHSTNLFYQHGTDHVLTYVSPQAFQFFGCSPEEAMQSWEKFLTDHPINKRGIQRTNEAIKTGKAQPSYKLQLRKKDGEIIWVRVNEAPVLEDGETVAMVGSLTDITELQDISEKEKMLSKVARETQNAVIITDLDRQVKWVNEAFVKETGYTLDEVKGKNPEFLQGPETDPQTVVFMHEKLENREGFSAEILNYTKTGEPYWINLNVSPIMDDHGNVIQFFSIQEDVTERKSFLERLKQKRERLEEAQRIGKIGNWDFDLKSGEISWSDQMYEIYDRDPEKGPPDYDHLLKYYPDIEEAKRHDEKVRQAIETGENYALDIKARTEKGEEKYVHAEGYTSTDKEGIIVTLHGIVQDITDRKEKELEIIAQQRQIQTVIDNIKGCLYRYVQRPDGSDEMVYISSGIEDLLGVTPEQAKESTKLLWEIVDDRDKERFGKSVQKSADTLEPWRAQWRIKSPQGEKKWIRGTGQPIRLENGTIQWDTLIVDITQEIGQQELNETLIQEVHHRVKNNLAIIIGFLDLQLHDLPDDSWNRLPLERAITRIHSISQVHKLLYEGDGFSDINVSDYLKSLETHITSTMNLKTAVDFDIDAADLKMNVNELTPLGMLLNELITNSVKYAFTDNKHGRITIKASKDEDAYRVHYKDNGRGIDKTRFEDAKTSGFNIVKILLAQLEADYQLLDEDGFSLAFSFRERTKGAHGNVSV